MTSRMVPGTKALFMLRGRLQVSPVASVSPEEDLILLENGMWFKGGRSMRHGDCMLLDGSPETIAQTERYQEFCAAVTGLTLFFSDQGWPKRISPELALRLNTQITEELVHADT